MEQEVPVATEERKEQAVRWRIHMKNCPTHLCAEWRNERKTFTSPQGEDLRTGQTTSHERGRSATFMLLQWGDWHGDSMKYMVWTADKMERKKWMEYKRKTRIEVTLPWGRSHGESNLSWWTRGLTVRLVHRNKLWVEEAKEQQKTSVEYQVESQEDVPIHPCRHWKRGTSICDTTSEREKKMTFMSSLTGYGKVFQWRTRHKNYMKWNRKDDIHIAK